MHKIYLLCVCLSVGTIAGVICGAIKSRIRKKEYTEKQKILYQKLWKAGSRFLTFFTLLILVLGLIWTVYFLILGAVQPQMTDYANNMSELIVSVLTVVSIIFAFYEFIRRK